MNRYVCFHGHFYLSKKIETELAGKKQEEKMKKMLEYSRELGKYLGVKTS